MFLLAPCVLVFLSGCAAERGYGPQGQGTPGHAQGAPATSPNAPPPSGPNAVLANGAQGDNIQIDPRAVALLNDFLAALQRNGADMDAAGRAAAPYLHKSLLRPGNPADLNDDLKNFSFKKAWQNAHFYANPVNITRIRKNNVTAIGAGDTGEAGYVVDYFVGKLNAQTGMPAPVSIFFPSSGAPPKISYVGSL